MGMLEGVQRKATRMIKGLGKLSYEKRCHLTTLEKQRGLLEALKILGEGRPFASTVFEATKSASTRGHNCRLFKL